MQNIDGYNGSAVTTSLPVAFINSKGVDKPVLGFYYFIFQEGIPMIEYVK